MRVIWITHDVFDVFYPYVKGKPTRGRPWIVPLFYNIHCQNDIKLAVVTPIIDGEEQRYEIDDIRYYSIRIGKKGNTVAMNTATVNRYISVINDFHPDIIHVHGTEINFGLLRKYVDEKIPIVCSIQGIIPPCYEYLKFSVANIEINRYRSIKNILGRGGVNYALKKWKRYGHLEKEIFGLNQYFIGRTMWDRAYLAAYNSSATYYHGEELLRSPFYNANWNLDSCERNRIFVSSSEYPLKGFHVMLKAAEILKKKYPNIKIAAPLSSLRKERSKPLDFLISEDYSNYLKKEITRLGLEKNVELMQNLSAEEMANEFKKAHVFALPSFLENSPNALGEALMIGTPTVVAPVGGVTSIVEDEKSTLFFPSGDYVMLAYQIERLFSNEKLALQLSKSGKAIAERRHNVTATTKQYFNIYKDILMKHVKPKEHEDRYKS